MRRNRVGFRADRAVPIEVSIPLPLTRKRPGIVVHRRRDLAADITRHRGIPITTPLRTLIDLGTRLTTRELEAAVNEADKLDLIDPESPPGPRCACRPTGYRSASPSSRPAHIRPH
jgi:hypothetical protein